MDIAVHLHRTTLREYSLPQTPSHTSDVTHINAHIHTHIKHKDICELFQIPFYHTTWKSRFSCTEQRCKNTASPRRPIIHQLLQTYTRTYIHTSHTRTLVNYYRFLSIIQYEHRGSAAPNNVARIQPLPDAQSYISCYTHILAHTYTHHKVN